jgi:hypothetical protein
MREVASMLAAYWAFGCAHAASRGDIPPIGKLRERPRLASMLRAVAIGAFLLSIALWPNDGSFWLPFLGSSLSLFVSASLVILVRPLAPRAVWGLFWASPILIALFAMGFAFGH